MNIWVSEQVPGFIFWRLAVSGEGADPLMAEWAMSNEASLASSVLEDMWAVNACTEEATHEQICSMKRWDHIKFIKREGLLWVIDRPHVCVLIF